MKITLTTKRIAWITDSTAYIPEKLQNHPDVYCVPLNIHFGEQEYIDGIDVSAKELYHKIKTTKEFPKSSQPSIGKFTSLYEKLSEDYDEAIAIHVSSKLSGTLASSQGGAEISNFPVTIIDSLALSYGITGLIDKGMEMQKVGASVQEIKSKLHSMASTFKNYILIGKLDQLYKGGRMGAAQYYLGSLLKIKPIVQISTDGELHPIDKVRSEKRAMQYLVKKAVKAHQNGVKKIYIMHGNVLSQAQDLSTLITKEAPSLQLEIGDISSVLAVHAGEGTLAITWYQKS